MKKQNLILIGTLKRFDGIINFKIRIKIAFKIKAKQRFVINA